MAREQLERPVYAKEVGEWRNRIIGVGEESPKQLLANELNWRTHPRFQRDVVEESLSKVGWVGPVVVNVRSSDEWGNNDKGVHTVVDGHLRVFLAINAEQESIPVEYVDLSPEEERVVLLTLDPTTMMAGVDADVLRDLIEDVDKSDLFQQTGAMKKLIEKMKDDHGLYDLIEPVDIYETDEELVDGEEHTCPKCGFTFVE